MPKASIETSEKSKYRTNQLYLSWRKTEVSKLFFLLILLAVPSQINNSIMLLFEHASMMTLVALVILFFFTKLFFTGLLKRWNRIHVQSNWSAFSGMTFQSQHDVQSFNVTLHNRAVWIIPLRLSAGSSGALWVAQKFQHYIYFSLLSCCFCNVSKVSVLGTVTEEFAVSFTETAMLSKVKLK